MSSRARCRCFFPGALSASLGYHRTQRARTLLTSTSTWENRAAKVGMYFLKNIRSMYTEFPANKGCAWPVCFCTNSRTCCSASPSVRVLFRTPSTRPLAVWCSWHHSPMPARSTSACLMIKSGPSMIFPSLPSVTMHAISSTLSFSRSSPVISRSIHTRGILKGDVPEAFSPPSSVSVPESFCLFPPLPSSLPLLDPCPVFFTELLSATASFPLSSCLPSTSSSSSNTDSAAK